LQQEPDSTLMTDETRKSKNQLLQDAQQTCLHLQINDTQQIWPSRLDSGVWNICNFWKWRQ